MSRSTIKLPVILPPNQLNNSGGISTEQTEYMKAVGQAIMLESDIAMYEMGSSRLVCGVTAEGYATLEYSKAEGYGVFDKTVSGIYNCDKAKKLKTNNSSDPKKLSYTTMPVILSSVAMVKGYDFNVNEYVKVKAGQPMKNIISTKDGEFTNTYVLPQDVEPRSAMLEADGRKIFRIDSLGEGIILEKVTREDICTIADIMKHTLGLVVAKYKGDPNGDHNTKPDGIIVKLGL
jgi:hypothetical protein